MVDFWNSVRIFRKEGLGHKKTEKQDTCINCNQNLMINTIKTALDLSNQKFNMEI